MSQDRQLSAGKLESGPPRLTAREIVWAYCENEVTYGYPCRTEGCPHCGGPEHAEATARAYLAMHRKQKAARPGRANPRPRQRV